MDPVELAAWLYVLGQLLGLALFLLVVLAVAYLALTGEL